MAGGFAAVKGDTTVASRVSIAKKVPACPAPAASIQATPSATPCWWTLPRSTVSRGSTHPPILSITQVCGPPAGARGAKCTKCASPSRVAVLLKACSTMSSAPPPSRALSDSHSSPGAPYTSCCSCGMVRDTSMAVGAAASSSHSPVMAGEVIVRLGRAMAWRRPSP